MKNTILTGEQLLKMYGFFIENNFDFKFTFQHKDFLSSKLDIILTRDDKKYTSFVSTCGGLTYLYNFQLDIFQKNKGGIDKHIFFDITLDTPFNDSANKIFPEITKFCVEEFVYVVCNLFFSLISCQSNFHYQIFCSKHKIDFVHSIFKNSVENFKKLESFFTMEQINEMLEIKTLGNEYRNFYTLEVVK